MKKLLFLLLLIASPLMAQILTPGVRYVATAPSGACVEGPPVQVLNSSGVIYTCANGTWTVQTGSGTGFPNPLNGPGQLIVGGTSGTPTVLPANTNATPSLLVSTAGLAGAVPSASTCANQVGFPGTGNTSTCTWSTALTSGLFVAVNVSNAGSGTVFTVTDSASNTYTAYGAVHNNAAIGVDVQTFYFGPLASSITSVTVTVPSGGSYLTVMADAVSGIATSSPTDGQAVADGTSAPFSTAPITTTLADYVFCGAVGNNGSGLGAGSGFTIGSRVQPPIYTAVTQYTVQTVAGAITPSVGGSTTGATLQCSAFKTRSPSATADTWEPLIVGNVRMFGAIGNGVSNPACTALGLANLAALQAYGGGIYSFATACTNQMDWLATQYTVNLLTGAAKGGKVQIPAGTYVWDQPVILPQSFDDPATNPSITIAGDASGGTFIVPNVGDFGAGSGMLSCSTPTNATPTGGGGGGNGRYSGGPGSCYSKLTDLTFYNPYTSGTVNLTDTTYAGGIINVPAPRNSQNGNPVYMDGIIMGARMMMDRVVTQGFRMGYNVIGDHMAWRDLYGQHNFCGMYWAPQSLYLEADLVMTGHNFINGNTLAGMCVDKDAALSLWQTGELYVGFQPYGFIKFPGTADSYLPAGYTQFLEGGSYQQIQAEAIGNAIIWDDNLTNASGGLTINATGPYIKGTTIESFYTSWGSGQEITTGGRAQYAQIASHNIVGLKFINLSSDTGNFYSGGSGQLAGIISVGGGGGGGIDISGDPAQFVASYSSYPFLSGGGSGTCVPTSFHEDGQWDGYVVTLSSSVGAVTAGQLIMLNSSAQGVIADGTKAPIGMALQSYSSGAGKCLAVASSGNNFIPQMTAVDTPANGALVVSTAGGQVISAGPAGGYVAGVVAAGGGHNFYPTLQGLGTFIPGTGFSTTGDFLYGSSTGASVRLAGNGGTAQDVIVSQGSGGSAPSALAYTCAHQSFGTTSTSTCSWSIAPSAGQYVVVNVQNNSNNASFSVTDSAGNIYVPSGPIFTNAAGTSQIQAFAFGPLASSITTLTLTATNPGYPTVLGQAVTNLSPSLAIEGQCHADPTVSSAIKTCTSAIVLAQTNDYIACGAGDSTNTNTFTAGTGFTAGSTSGGNVLSQYLVNAGAGSFTPTINGTNNAHGAMLCTAYKNNGVPASTFLTSSPALSTASMFAGGTTFTVAGCGTATSLAGGSLAGKFNAGATSCAPVITTNVTAPNGYFCTAQDLTTPADLLKQASSTTTTATFGTATVVSGDTITFGCTAY